jgi:hypothetical protein
MSKFIEVVPFHNHGIATLREGDSVLVVMKPLVEMLGLAWQGQLERIKRHPVLSEGIRVTLIPSTSAKRMRKAAKIGGFGLR